MHIRCVIVDDNADFLDAASGLLEQEGINVVGIASTGAQAYRASRELQPDVMLIDVDLDNETGFEVASGLAQGAGQEQPRVILISAHDPDEFENLMADAPAAAVVSKTRLSGQMIRDIIGSAGPAIRGGSQRDSR
jgi:two-component system, NarL family, nitrate/nitrite response regulator NarL